MADDIEQQNTGPQAEPEVKPAEANLTEELAKVQAQANDYLDQWRRTAADFSNYRKRVEREREEMSRFSSALLLSKILPVLDDFERAMATLPGDLRAFSWVEGVALIQHKLWLTLEGEGLKPIEAAGQPFDPTRHEAILREETTAYPDGQVIAELQRGYELHGRVLRPALVKVAVAKPGAEATGGDEGTKETRETEVTEGAEDTEGNV